MMKRIAAPIVGGIVTSLIIELTLFTAIFYFAKRKELNRINKSKLNIK